MIKIGVMLLFLLALLNGCLNNSSGKECEIDTDCASAGCSGQLCAGSEKAKDIITTCEYKEEYECLKLTTCGCVSNKCQWAENEGYNKCIGEVRS